MNSLERQNLLKIVAGACIGLLFLNYAVLDPAIHRWSEQSERIAALRAKVDKGQLLLAHESDYRNRWAAMLRTSLSANDSTAQAACETAVSRWQGASGITVNSTNAQWQTRDDEGYDALEFRVSTTGDQISLGHFLYELGTDPTPCNLEECEISTRDAHGTQLNMAARFSFVRVDPDINAGTGSTGGSRSNGRGGNGDE